MNFVALALSKKLILLLMHWQIWVLAVTLLTDGWSIHRLLVVLFLMMQVFYLVIDFHNFFFSSLVCFMISKGLGPLFKKIYF